MSNHVLPPTPAPSTDIAGREDLKQQAHDYSFKLPSPAIGSTEGSEGSASSDSSYHPGSPTGPSRKRPRKSIEGGRSNQSSTKDDVNFSLPPPPSRARKIIQMKPGQVGETSNKTSTASTLSKTKGRSVSSSNGPGVTGSSKKQASMTTAAGKKAARKTAHSVIERRRRSRMNEEYGVLKDMIPACKGHEMHKLAILQAAIDYMRYLERCMTDLKASKTGMHTVVSTPSLHSSHIGTPHRVTEIQSRDEEEDDKDEECVGQGVEVNGMEEHEEVEEGEDEEEEEEESIGRDTALSSYQASPALTAQESNTSQAFFSNNVSPAITINSYQHQRNHRFSYSSASLLPSPAIEPQRHHQPLRTDSFFSNSSLPDQQQPPLWRPTTSYSCGPSPIIAASPSGEPHDPADHEATAALLMLNNDRRHLGSQIGSSVNVGAKRKGMSVQDLLTS